MLMGLNDFESLRLCVTNTQKSQRQDLPCCSFPVQHPSQIPAFQLRVFVGACG